MTFRFDPAEGLIVIRVRLVGPSGEVIIRCALDTGATSTVINSEVIAFIGYDSSISSERIQIITGSGIEFCPRVVVSKLEALGQSLSNFPVLCHTLPPSSQVDGLIGVDFFKTFCLKIDFRVGIITLDSARLAL